VLAIQAGAREAAGKKEETLSRKEGWGEKRRQNETPFTNVKEKKINAD